MKTGKMRRTEERTGQSHSQQIGFRESRIVRQSLLNAQKEGKKEKGVYDMGSINVRRKEDTFVLR
jgi:hypothetical protein